MISSSYDFEAYLHRSQRCRSSQTALQWFEVLPGLSQALPGAPRLLVAVHRLVVDAPRLVAGSPRYSQACHRRSQTCRRHSQVIPGAPEVLSGAARCSQTYHKYSHGTPVPVVLDSSYSEGRPECPPMLWYSPEIDVSKFILHSLSDTAGGFQRLKYILLMLILILAIFGCIPETWRVIPRGLLVLWREAVLHSKYNTSNTLHIVNVISRLFYGGWQSRLEIFWKHISKQGHPRGAN